MHRVLDGERTFLSPVLRPVERGIYRVLGVDEKVEQPWTGYAVSVLRLLVRRRSSSCTVQQRIQGVAAAQPGRASGPSRRTSPSTPRSASSRTRTGRTTRRDDDDLPDPDGRAHRAELRLRRRWAWSVAIALARGLVRRSATTIGNFWVDVTRGTLYILLPDRVRRGARARLAGRGPDAQRRDDGRTRSRARSQTIALGPFASQEAIKELGNNGGRLLQRELGPPVREPERVHELARDVPHPAHPVRPDEHVRADGRRPTAGLGALRDDDGDPGRRARSSRCGARASATRSIPQAVIAGALGNMEGKEVRFGAAAERPLRHGDDRHEHRRRELDARQLPAARRPGPAVHDRARARSPPAASAPACTASLVFGASWRSSSPGLMVGRTPGVPGQEDRVLRDEDGDARRPLPRRRSILVLHRHRRGHAGRPGRPAERRAARLQRDPLRVLEPDGQQRLGVRGSDREHRLLQPDRRRSPCSSAASR